MSLRQDFNVATPGTDVSPRAILGIGCRQAATEITTAAPCGRSPGASLPRVSPRRIIRVSDKAPASVPIPSFIFVRLIIRIDASRSRHRQIGFSRKRPGNMSFPDLALHVGGEWMSRASGGERAVVNPADESLLAMLPLAGAAELQAAAESAQRGFAQWRARSALPRCTTLRDATADARTCRDIAHMLTLEQGKPLAEATREVSCRPTSSTSRPRRPSASVGRGCRRACRRSSRRRCSACRWARWRRSRPGIFRSTCRRARSAARWPRAAASSSSRPRRPLAPALALARAFPMPGSRPTRSTSCAATRRRSPSLLIAHPAIAKVSFTGSVAVGKHAGRKGRAAPQALHRRTRRTCAGDRLCRRRLRRRAARLAVVAKFRNAGQVCASPIRFYVQRGAYERFRERGLSPGRRRSCRWARAWRRACRWGR